VEYAARVLRLALWSLAHARLTAVSACLATLVLGAGALRVGSDSGYRAFLGAGHPVVRDLDAVAARFGGGVPFAISFACRDAAPCRSVFDPPALALAHALATQLAKVNGVRRVDGPATSPLLAPELFDLPRARQLAPEGRPAPDLAELAPRALADPLWAGQIVSPDGTAGALVVTLEDSASETAERAVDAALAALAPFEARGFTFALAGGPVEFVVAGRELDRAARRLVPAIVVLVGAIVWLAFRSAPLALLALAIVGLALLWSVGLQGWLGWPRNSFFQVLPPLLLTIGVCYGIHVVAAYAERLAASASGEGASRALSAALHDVARPCLYTALTTAAGFASFYGSGLESLVRFGWIAAFGVMASLVATFSLLPIALVRLPVRWTSPARTHAGWRTALTFLTRFAMRRPRLTLVLTALLSLLAAAGLARLRIDASFEEIYGEENQVVRWARAAAEVRSAETLELGLALPPGMEASAPEALATLAHLEAVAARPGLGRPLSILTPMRELHRLLHGDELVLAGAASEPERFVSLQRMLRREAPELFTLYVAPGALRLSLQGEKLPQDELRALVSSVERDVAAALPAGFSATVTGPLAVVSRMIDEIRATQISSFGSALVLVGVLAALCLRSVKLALLALVPTTLPVLLTLGAMGALGVPLDIGTAMVAAIVLGLGVDEALHLLSAYRRRRDDGLARDAAIDAALREVGPALLTSAAALGAGFLVLVFVPWKSLASFGAVTAVAIAASLLADLLLLPALLLVIPRRASRSR